MSERLVDDRALHLALQPSAREAPPDLRGAVLAAVSQTAQRRVLRWPVLSVPLPGDPRHTLLLRVVALGLLVLASLVVLVLVASRPTRPPLLANGLISFVREGDIWLVDPAVGVPRNLTRSPQFEAVAVWSPDGAWLAAIADANWSLENPAFSIDVMRADGGGRRSITGEASYFSTLGTLSWSPDGRWIATEHTLGEHSPAAAARIELVPVDGSGPRALPGLPVPARKPWFAPSGEWLAFFSAEGGLDRLYVVHPDGSGLRMLLETSATLGFYSTPEWTPDSRYVLVESVDRRFDMSLLLVDVTTGSVRDLTPGPDPAYGGYLSPDGGYLAFMRGMGACDSKLVVMNVETGEVVSETHNAVLIDWAPDGTSLYGLAARGRDAEPVEHGIVNIPMPSLDPGDPAIVGAPARPIVRFGGSAGPFSPYCDSEGPTVGGVQWQGLPR